MCIVDWLIVLFIAVLIICAISRSYFKVDGKIYMENPRKIGYAFGSSYDRHMSDEYKFDYNDYDESKAYYKQLILETDNEEEIIKLLFRRATAKAGINDQGLDLSDVKNLYSLSYLKVFADPEQSLIVANELDSFIYASSHIIEEQNNELIDLKDKMKDLSLDTQKSLMEIYTLDADKREKLIKKCTELNYQIEHRYRPIIL